MNKTAYENLIRIAYMNPELRDELLPLILKEAAGQDWKYWLKVIAGPAVLALAMMSPTARPHVESKHQTIQTAPSAPEITPDMTNAKKLSLALASLHDNTSRSHRPEVILRLAYDAQNDLMRQADKRGSAYPGLQEAADKLSSGMLDAYVMVSNPKSVEFDLSKTLIVLDGADYKIKTDATPKDFKKHMKVLRKRMNTRKEHFSDVPDEIDGGILNDPAYRAGK